MSLDKVLERLDRYTVTDTGCHVYAGGKDTYGYPQYKHKGRTYRLCRVSYECHVGPIPPGLHVLHKCDNPGCFNPGHLFLGTHADNMSDMTKKSRWKPLRGVSNGRAKLTDVQVRRIREYSEVGISRVDLARQFGVAPQMISRIARLEAWRHV